MRKITLTLLFLLYCLLGYSQLQEETFEGATFPPTGWGVYDNALGTFYSWQKSALNNTEQPPYEGVTAAFIQRENITNGIPEDWLITKRFTVPVNGKLTFYSRLTIVGDQGSIYQVKVSTNANQGALANYTLMQEWTESQINGVQQREYVKKELNFAPEFYGQEVYVAFIMKANFADRWLIDNVSATENCLNPENLIAENFTTTSAELSWDNPSGATQWEVEIVGELDAFNGTGVPYTGTLPYVPTLLEDTKYKYQVRAVCPLGGKSDWIGAVMFKTSRKGDVCTDPIVVNTLPYSNIDNTENAANNYNGTPGENCGVQEWGPFMDGNDVVYKFTPTEDQIITVKAAGLTNEYALMFVYTSCDDIGTNCIASDVNEYSLEDLKIPYLSVTAGITYYIVFSTSYSPTPYFFTIQREYCDSPEQLQAAAITTSSANLSWTEAGTSTSWQYALVAEGTGLPQGPGTDTTALTYNPTALPAGTKYEFYVRSNCGDGTYSSWAGPLYFNTLCAPVSTPYVQNFNSDSATEYCWSVADLNNDGKVWDMDTQWTTSEGDQSASFNTEGIGDNNDMLISPTLTIAPNLRLRFRYRTDSWSETAFKVTLSTTGTDPAGFTTELLPLTAYNLGDFKTRIIDLGPYVGQNVNIAWHVPAGEDERGAVFIDDIIIEPWPACAEPTELSATNITPTTAELLWEKGHNETAWEIGLKETSVSTEPPMQGDVLTPAPTNPFTFTNLIPNTSYTYYVRASCGPTSVSQWVGPFTFRTACLPFAVPFKEGFNSDSETESCWKIINANNDWSVWNLNTTYPPSFEGDQNASIFAGSNNINDWLVSPALMLTGNDRLKYHYEVGDGGARFRVMLSTTGTDVDDFTVELVPTELYNDTGGYIKKIVSLQGYTGTVYIAFHADPPTGGYSNINIDNFIVEPTPTCPEPGELVISNLTQTSAQVAWEAGGTETQWEVFVQLPGQGIPTGQGQPATSPYTITQLTNGSPIESGTTYEVYVRAICAPGDLSEWSDKARFTSIISNDECADAITVPVNINAECTVFRSGTTIGATMSAEEQCDEWSEHDDVWFEFVAQAEIHTVTFKDLPQSESVEYAIYQGGCDALVPLICPGSSNEGAVLRNLTIGETYKIRVFKYNFSDGTNFSICITSPVKPIAVSSTQYTIEELVRDVLVGSECSQVSNITYSTGTNYDGPNGIGYFTKNGSDFPFESGIILSSGNAENAPGPNHTVISGLGSDWAGDTDLEQIIEEGTGTPMSSKNATILEFDFIPLRNTISFDFMFASEEYGQFQCDFSDSFAFILTDAQGNSQNLAVVPGTSTPISVITIRDEMYNSICDSQNVDFFEGYYGPLEDGTTNGDFSATNYNGRTVVMQAQGSVVLGEPYHIKMVIADRQDEQLDSAVFLGAESFNLGRLTLGADMLVANGTAACQDTEVVLKSFLDPEAFIIKWTKDGVEIPGENGANLTVTEAGTYAISAELLGLSCTATDSVVIEFYPDVMLPLAQPLNLVECADIDKADFNLESNTAVILNSEDPDNYTITYHASAEDAASGDNALASPYENTQSPQTIYAKITNNSTTCTAVTTFTLTATPKPQFTLPANFSVCDGNTATIAVDPINFNLIDATYKWTMDGNDLNLDTASISVTQPGVYQVTVTYNNCESVKEVTVTVTPIPVADAPADITMCDVYGLPALSPGNTYRTGAGGTGNILEVGYEVKTTQTIYVFAESGTTPNCTAENSFTVTIIPTPSFDLGGPYYVCETSNTAISVANANFTDADVTYSWTVNGVDVGNNTATITATAFGKYELTVTRGICTASVSVDVTINDSAFELVFTDGCDDNKYSVEVSDKDGSFNVDTATYSWTGPGNFTSTDREIFPKVKGDYTVTVTTAEGCISEETFPVISTTCDIPRGVSPNGDTKNDTFDLSSLDVKKLAIFNRYGQEVYTKNNYKDEWHGQGSNGDELPTGTYFYMIERINGESKTGWVYLNRED